MRQTLPLLIIVAAVVVIGYLAYIVTTQPADPSSSDGTENREEADTHSQRERENTTSADPTVSARRLEIPWDIAFLPDGSLLATERSGRVVHIESGTTYEVGGVVHTGESGLLGIVLHPRFEDNNYVYLYQTTEVSGGLENQVNRYIYKDDSLVFDRTIVSGIAGAAYHDGGRIEFGPDGYLWIATGDAGSEASAQDPNTLAGSILRVTDDGSIPDDNPFENAVWSYGHRNPQGLAWDSEGRLWSTEHGRSGVLSGMDEINLIERGGNYGWPKIQGNETEEEMILPAAHSGPDVTWAPASAAYHDGSLYFGGLRGEALYEAILDGEDVVEVKRHYSGTYGRIRTVRVGPDSMLYLTTSNRDGRGKPVSEDDRIIKIDPASLQ